MPPKVVQKQQKIDKEDSTATDQLLDNILLRKYVR